MPPPLAMFSCADLKAALIALAPPAAFAAPAANAAPPVAAAATAMPPAVMAAPAPREPTFAAPPTLAPVMIPATMPGILLTSAKRITDATIIAASSLIDVTDDMLAWY